MVWQCLIISAKFPANLFPIHSLPNVPAGVKGASCSAENESLSAVRLKIMLLFYFHNLDQLQWCGNKL